jgi:membrane protein YdbS with pleckstrin-like domain
MSPDQPQEILRINPSFKPILLVYSWTGLFALAGLALAPLTAGLSLALGAPIFYAFYFHLDRNKTHYILTTHDLTVRTGILSKSSTHIPLSKVQDVTVRQSFLERIFNIGDIVVESAGAGGRIPQLNVDNPEQVCRRILMEVGLRDTETRRSG